MDVSVIEELTDLLADCHDDFDLFNSAVLQRPDYWSGGEYPGQVEWCRALVEYRTLSIETGNQTGKDYWIGGIIPGWLWTRPNSLVIVTGPGQTVLGSVTWKEVRRAVEGCPFWKAGIFRGKISSGIKTSPHTLEVMPGWTALAFSTVSVERASGQHSAELLVIVEEASGVEPEVWDAIDSLGYTKLVAIGNPLRAEGGFVDLCNQAESDAARGVPMSEATCHFNLPSTASPHATWDKSPFGLADRTWLDAVARKYGHDSLWYRSHVLAIRPTLTNERLIPIEHLDLCVSDDTASAVSGLRAEGKGDSRWLGCDVGEGVGNARTVVIVRDHLGILEIHASRYTGPIDAAEWMGRLAGKWRVSDARISYDGAGQTGKRLGNALSALGLGGSRPYFGSGSGGKRCTNLRTAAALALARRLDPGHHVSSTPRLPFYIPPDEHWTSIREELGELRYELLGDKSALELKQDMMERLGRSPDFADAITQTFREEAVKG